MHSLASTDFSDVFKPKPVGETINTHVVPAVPEPRPDYDAMQRLIEGGKLPSPPPRDER